MGVAMPPIEKAVAVRPQQTRHLHGQGRAARNDMAGLGELEEVEHLVGGADPERDAADEDVAAERPHDEASREVGRAEEVGFHLCQDSSA